MKCPNCRLENPNTAQRCDCGFDFLTKTIETPYVKGGVRVTGTKNPWPYIAAGAVGILFSKLAMPMGPGYGLGLLLSFVIFFFGCFYLAKQKGYPGWWASFAFLFLLGLIVLVALPNKTKS